jgi:hypothetical protein
VSRTSGSNVRVGLVSFRKKEKIVSRFFSYEFEDIICEIDDAELIMPEPIHARSDVSRIIAGVGSRLHISQLNASILPIKLEKDYELLVVNCLNIKDLSVLNACRDWRKKAQKAVCCIVETWSQDLGRFGSQLEILSKFDYVVLNTYNCVDILQRLVGKPVLFMAPSVNTVRFCPYPQLPDRCIDVYSMGRKSQVTLNALLDFSERERLFFLFDTFENMTSQNFEHHRHLLASLIKRCRYFCQQIEDRISACNGASP